LFVDGDFPRLPMLERGFIVVALDQTAGHLRSQT
jgi:hypothetical protein